MFWKEIHYFIEFVQTCWFDSFQKINITLNLIYLLNFYTQICTLTNWVSKNQSNNFRTGVFMWFQEFEFDSKNTKRRKKKQSPDAIDEAKNKLLQISYNFSAFYTSFGSFVGGKLNGEQFMNFICWVPAVFLTNWELK